jgi:hypothetical protein
VQAGGMPVTRAPGARSARVSWPRLAL